MAEKEQFNDIYNRHYNKVFRLCKGYFCGDTTLASDATQEIFIKVWEKLDTFRNDSSISTWIYRIATNESITFLNKKKLKNNISLDDVSGELAETLASSSYFDGDKIQRKLQEAILTLPEKQRIIFNMKYFDDMKYDEISEVLGTSVGALKASFHIAVKKIESILINQD